MKLISIRNSVILLTLGSLAYACGSHKPIADSRVRIATPHSSMSKTLDSLNSFAPKEVKYVDAKGVEHIVTSAIEEDNGETTMLCELGEVRVIAKSKNVAERNGKINMDFLITVPAELLSNKWQLQLTPIAQKGDRKIALDKILLSGADFAKMQKRGYLQYQAFINSIVPDSMYLKKMFNQKGYKKAMEDLEEEYYQAWKREVTQMDEWIDWKDKMNRRFLYFNNIMERNKMSIEGSKSILSILPSYWMKRELSGSFVPNKYLLFTDKTYKIRQKKITPDDSVKISRRYTDFKKIADNERKKQMKDEMFNKLVKFPIQPARLDTIIQHGDKFTYYYSQEMPVDDNIKRIDLTLNGRTVSKNEEITELPASDTIQYFISSMVQFLDPDPRYKKKIVTRKDEKNMTAYIHFKQGSAVVDTTLDDNSKEIAKINDFVNKINFSGEFLIDSVYMTATSSPEGSSLKNLQLSKERALAFKNFLIHLQDGDKMGIDSILVPKWKGEDWDKLYTYIQNDDTLKSRNMFLDIIKDKSIKEDMKEANMRVCNKKDYDRVYEKYYPLLRGIDFKFYVHRRNMIQDTIVMPVLDEDYLSAIEMVKERKYKDALALLSDQYPNDYNTGIVLMSLGYNSKALEVMQKQAETPNRDYIIAILYARLGKEREAVQYLMNACEKDESKIYRGKLDPEINELIVKYKLFKDIL